MFQVLYQFLNNFYNDQTLLTLWEDLKQKLRSKKYGKIILKVHADLTKNPKNILAPIMLQNQHTK